jgi:hypothetical protein
VPAVVPAKDKDTRWGSLSLPRAARRSTADRFSRAPPGKIASLFVLRKSRNSISVPRISLFHEPGSPTAETPRSRRKALSNFIGPRPKLHRGRSDQEGSSKTSSSAISAFRRWTSFPQSTPNCTVSDANLTRRHDKRPLIVAITDFYLSGCVGHDSLFSHPTIQSDSRAAPEQGEACQLNCETF